MATILRVEGYPADQATAWNLDASLLEFADRDVDVVRR